MIDKLKYEEWRRALAEALMSGQREQFKALLKEAPEPISPKRLFGVIVETETGERTVVVVDHEGNDLKGDTMVGPDTQLDFLNASLGVEGF